MIALALLLRWLLDPVLGNDVPYIAVSSALLVLVMLVRPGPFLAAAALAWAGAVLLLIEPRFRWPTVGSSEWLQAATFALAMAAAGVTSWLAARAHDRRKGAEREVARVSDELCLVTDAMPALISYVDAEMRYRFVNQPYLDWYERPREAILGRHVAEVLGGEAFERVRAEVEAALAGERVQFEAEVPYRERGLRWIHADLVPHVRPDGAVAGYYALITDITARMHAELERDRFFALSVDMLGIASTRDGTWKRVNPAFTRILGWSEAELLAIPYLELVHPADLARSREATNQIAAGATLQSFEHRVRCRDGSYRWIAWHTAPHSAGGLMYCVGRDTTERRAAEERLRASQERQRIAVAAAGLGVFEWDVAANAAVFENERMYQLFGLTPADGIPSQQEFFESWLHPEDRVAFELAARAGLIPGATFHTVCRIRRPPFGDVRWVEFAGDFALDAAGEPLRLVGVVADVTDRKNAQDELADADRRKDEFIATLAHELRNPLAAIRSALALLWPDSAARASAAGPDDSRVEQLAAILARQTTQLVRLVDDLLDVGRITHGKIELRLQRLELAAVLEQAVETSRTECLDHVVDIALPEGPIPIDADPVRLPQVFGNLLSNACKYGRGRGSVRLTAQREGSEVVVRVKDDGIGIPAERLQSIFEMFSQVESALERSRGGLGIGLALAKSFVELHGGTITAHSAGPGHGSEFVVRLPLASGTPLAPHANGHSEAARRSDDEPCRVLVVDDNVDAAETLAMLLELTGHHVRIAHDGVGAMELARSFAPDVVLLDLGLPGTDGYEVCRALREHPANGAIAIVAVTGWGGQAVQDRAAESGFDAHLVKPVDPSELPQLLTELTVARRGR